MPLERRFFDLLHPFRHRNAGDRPLIPAQSKYRFVSEPNNSFVPNIQLPAQQQRQHNMYEVSARVKESVGIGVGLAWRCRCPYRFGFRSQKVRVRVGCGVGIRVGWSVSIRVGWRVSIKVGAAAKSPCACIHLCGDVRNSSGCRQNTKYIMHGHLLG